MEPDYTKYDLTEEEYQRCLARAEAAIFMRSQPSKNPRSIFVVAQAGAGKTGLKSYIINEAQDSQTLGPFIEFNPDEVAVHHEHYREILREFPEQSHMILQKFVNPALDTYLRKRAVELRNNIVQEGTFGNTNGYLNIINVQKNGGYNVDINILAVDRLASLLSCYEREQYFKEAGLPLRTVTMANHDRAYENLLNTVRTLEQRKLFDRMRVFRRGYTEERPQLVYVSGDRRYKSVVDAIIAQRNESKKEILNYPEEFMSKLEILKEKAKDSKQQMLKLMELEEQFRNEMSFDYIR